MTESNDTFRKLEEKLNQAVLVFSRTRQEKRALELELEKLKTDFKERAKRWETMEHELQVLRREREEVRGRIERLIEKIDGLTSPDTTG